MGKNNVSMSIVTYNSADEIENVLSSLNESDLDGINVKVFVIDNNSTDNTVPIIEKKYPKVALIKNKKNVGFGAAHNEAIKKIDSKYHIIVNPDIKFLKNTVKDLVSYMEKNPDVVLVTPKILNDDKKKTEQFLPKKYPRIRYALSGLLENKFRHYKKLRDEYTMRDAKIDNPCEIDFCTGCFMFCRTESLKKVKGFDDRYFLYYEDADLTRKLKMNGKTVFVPSIEVIHKWQRENHKNLKAARAMVRSLFIYLGKWNLGVIKK